MEQLMKNISGMIALIILSILTFGTFTQTIDPRCAVEISYSTMIVVKSISKRLSYIFQRIQRVNATNIYSLFYFWNLPCLPTKERLSTKTE